MKLEEIPFFTTDWVKIQPTEHTGERGKAFWRTLQLGDTRIRMVEYTKDYLADWGINVAANPKIQFKNTHFH